MPLAGLDSHVGRGGSQSSLHLSQVCIYPLGALGTCYKGRRKEIKYTPSVGTLPSPLPAMGILPSRWGRWPQAQGDTGQGPVSQVWSGESKPAGEAITRLGGSPSPASSWGLGAPEAEGPLWHHLVQGAPMLWAFTDQPIHCFTEGLGTSQGYHGFILSRTDLLKTPRPSPVTTQKKV